MAACLLFLLLGLLSYRINSQDWKYGNNQMKNSWRIQSKDLEKNAIDVVCWPNYHIGHIGVFEWDRDISNDVCSCTAQYVLMSPGGRIRCHYRDNAFQRR